MLTRVGIDGTWKIGFEEVAHMLGDLHGKQILDYGCGTGRSTAFLTSLGAVVVGVDVSSSMIQTARQLHPSLDFCLLGDTDLSDFDIAFSSFVHVEIPTFPGMRRVANTVYEALLPNRRYVILTADPDSCWGKSYESFSSSFPSSFRGRSGDIVHVQIYAHGKIIECSDYFWKLEDYVPSLGRFQIQEIRTPKPFMIIDAMK